jgi:hypothetical protein
VRYEWLFVTWALVALGCVATPPEDLDAAPEVDAAVALDAYDGPLERRACTDAFGSAIPNDFGRLDGRLVAIVPPGFGGCRADADHVRLQILVGAAVYDVAVTTRSSMNPGMPEVYLGRIEHAPPGPPFAEGFHADVPLDYPFIGVHSTDLAPLAEDELVAAIEAALADVHHVSIFATGYVGGDGAHLVHRNGGGRDGAIVLHPFSASSGMLVFRFDDQTF